MAIPCSERSAIEGLLGVAKSHPDIRIGPWPLQARVETPAGPGEGTVLHLIGVSVGTTMCGHDWQDKNVAVYGAEQPARSPFRRFPEGAPVYAAVLVIRPTTPQPGQSQVYPNEFEAILLRLNGESGRAVRTHIRERYRTTVSDPVLS